MRFERLLALALALVLVGCGATSPRVRSSADSSSGSEAARVNTALGQQYLRQGQLEIALDKLQRALSYDSGYVDAHTVIAVLYERIGELDKAEQHYRRAAQLRPKGGAELNNYAVFLCKEGQHEEARKYFERALADPFYRTPAVASGNFGSCLVKAGRRDEGEVMLRRALQLDPNDAETLLQLASVSYAKAEYFNARGFMQRFEALAPARPEALMLARNIELKLGNATAARGYLQKLLRDFPESPQAQTLNVKIQRDENAR